MTGLIIFLLVVIVVAGALPNYWGAIASLPESSAAFLGALAGVGGGLLAILAGAFANAHLNRRRDDRLRIVEIVAVTNALVAELRKLHSFSSDQAARLQKPPRASLRAIAIGRPPSIPVFEKLTGHQLGLLDSEALKNLVEVHHKHEILTRVIEETIANSDNLDELASDKTLDVFIRRHSDLAQDTKTVARALISCRPKL